MALDKGFLAYSRGGHNVSLNLTLLFYFSFNYHHAKDYPAGIPIIPYTVRSVEYTL